MTRQLKTDREAPEDIEFRRKLFQQTLMPAALAFYDVSPLCWARQKVRDNSYPAPISWVLFCHVIGTSILELCCVLSQ